MIHIVSKGVFEVVGGFAGYTVVFLILFVLSSLLAAGYAAGTIYSFNKWRLY